MLEFFKQNKLFNSLLLLPYTILLRINSFLVEFDYQTFEGNYLTELFYQTLGYNEILLDIIAVLLIFIQGVFVNLIVIKNRLSTSINLFPGVFYILLVSLIPEFQYLSPELIANSFLLVAITQIFGIYKKQDVSVSLFNAGFAISVASVFSYYFLLFIPPIFIVFIKLRKIKLIENLQLITGFWSFLFLFFSTLYITDQYQYFMESLAANLQFGAYMNFSFNIALLKMLVFIILIIICIFRYSKNMLKRSYKSQKQNTSLYWFLLFSVFIFFICPVLSLNQLILLTVPLAILSSFLPSQYINRWYAEGFHLCLFIIAICFQYQALL